MFPLVYNKKNLLYFIYKLFTILLLFIFYLTLWFQTSLISYAAPDAIDEETIRKQIPIESNSIENWPEGPVISAQSAILIDANTGTILYEKNAHDMLYPASTTKIMSALLAYENCELDETVTFSHEAVFSVPWDGSKIAMDEGEELPMEDCLNAILIRSANEVTNAVAEHVSGSIPDFVELMNQRAKELGCLHTNFANANGLHNENHYTTAYDLAMIGRAFFSNELLCKMSTTKLLHLYPTEKQPDEILEHNHNQLLPGKKYAYEYYVGGKTGFTDQALSTLVTCAQKDELKLICVVLKEKAPAHYEDTITLFDYGFSNFEALNISQIETKYQIESNNLYHTTNDIFGNSNPILNMDTNDYIVLPKTASFDDVTSTLNYDVDKKNCAAQIDYFYHETHLGSASILLTENLNDSYYFEEVTTDLEEKAPTNNIIFINIFKIILWILLVATGLILFILLRSFLHSYQINGRDSRRKWKQRRKKRRRPKRPNRFRDYDF